MWFYCRELFLLHFILLTCMCTHNLWETKAKFPWDQALGESIMFKLKRSIGLEKSVIILNRLCFLNSYLNTFFLIFVLVCRVFDFLSCGSWMITSKWTKWFIFLCHFGFLGHAGLLEESMIFPHATTISNKEPSLGLKTYIVWFLCQRLVN